MRLKLCATVSENTTAVIHRVMKEQNCNKNEAVDFLVVYYADSQKKIEKNR